MAALNCTVASVPAREYVFVSTDANARTGKRGDCGGEAGSKVLGAYGRDKLNENGKLLLGFAEDDKLALLNTFFCALISGVPYTFQSGKEVSAEEKQTAKCWAHMAETSPTKTANYSSVCFPCSSPISGLMWFGSVYLVTTAGFVADHLM